MILGAVSPHFKSHNGEIWHEGADLLHAKFCKNILRGCTPFEQIYTKKYRFWRLQTHTF